MARKRIFDNLTEGAKMHRLLKFLTCALEDYGTEGRIDRTDIWGCARQFGGDRIKKSDFDLIKKMTIEELANKIILERKTLLKTKIKTT